MSVPTAEELLNAAAHIAAAEAKIGVMTGAAPGVTVDAAHYGCQLLLSDHLFEVLEAFVLHVPLCRYLADTIAADAFEGEREAGCGPEELAPLSVTTKAYLHELFVRKHSETRHQNGAAEAPLQCAMCEGVAETGEGMALAHSDHCPLCNFDGEGA